MNSLVEAAKNGNPEVVVTLIKDGADVHAKDSAGKTALEYARMASMFKNRTKAMLALAEAGADMSSIA